MNETVDSTSDQRTVITVEDAIERLILMSQGYCKAKQAEAMRMGAAALRRLKEIEDWTDTRLSERARPGIEVPQWVNDEIKQLELKLASIEIPAYGAEPKP